MAAKISSGGGGKRGQQEVNSDPNVIPFIDVMLVLLIIFMIAAPISSVDISVEMPKAKIVPSKRPPRPTWISLQDNFGDVKVYVMNEETTFAKVGEKTLEEWQKNSPRLNFEEECSGAAPNPYCRVYIRADGETAYRNVVRVMNRLQDEGFTLIGLVAEDRR